ncbi:MAG: GNAT family N-acetyltransferase [Streptosporangiaceae bacterium]
MQDVSGPGGETRCARPAGAPGQAAPDPVTIAAMRPEHASAVLDIYQDGIDEGNATFETAAPSWPAFTAARLAAHRYVALGPLARPGNVVTTLPSYQRQRHHVADAAGVAPGREGDADGVVLGWVAVSAVSGRPAYAGSSSTRCTCIAERGAGGSRGCCLTG